MAASTEYSIKAGLRLICPWGLMECPFSGLGVCAIGKADVDFGRHPDGTTKLRIAYMGYDWHF